MARKRLTCSSCNTRIPMQSFCSACGHPTSVASEDERILWEMGQWDRRTASPPERRISLEDALAGRAGSPAQRIAARVGPAGTRTPRAARPPLQPLRPAPKPRGDRPLVMGTSGSSALAPQPAAPEHAPRPAQRPRPQERPETTRPETQRPAAARTETPAPRSPRVPTFARSNREQATTTSAATATVEAPPRPRPAPPPQRVQPPAPAKAPAAPASPQPAMRTGTISVTPKAEPPPQPVPVPVPAPEPVAEEPVAEAPVVEQPAVEAPVVEAPVVEAPVVDRRSKRSREERRLDRLADALAMCEGEEILHTAKGSSRERRAWLVTTNYRVALVRGRKRAVQWIPLEEVTGVTLRKRTIWIEAPIEILDFVPATEMRGELLAVVRAAVGEARVPGSSRHHPELVQQWCDRVTQWDSSGRLRLWLRRQRISLKVWVPPLAALLVMLVVDRLL
ncbi:MAG TPA: hypothetical protein VGB83_05735 [Actinomycetota bacterium]